MIKSPVRLVLCYVGFIILFLAMVSTCGCEVLKKKSSVVKDSIVTSKVDTGRVVVTTTDRKDSLAWWREIVNFARDTTIIANNIYPTSYIREGGVRTIESKSVNYDSLWNIRLDSLSYRLSQTNKSKETKVLNMWQIIGLSIGACLVFLIGACLVFLLITKLKIR